MFSLSLSKKVNNLTNKKIGNGKLDVARTAKTKNSKRLIELSSKNLFKLKFLSPERKKTKKTTLTHSKFSTPNSSKVSKKISCLVFGERKKNSVNNLIENLKSSSNVSSTNVSSTRCNSSRYGRNSQKKFSFSPTKETKEIKEVYCIEDNHINFVRVIQNEKRFINNKNIEIFETVEKVEEIEI